MVMGVLIVEGLAGSDGCTQLRELFGHDLRGHVEWTAVAGLLVAASKAAIDVHGVFIAGSLSHNLVAWLNLIFIALPFLEAGECLEHPVFLLFILTGVLLFLHLFFIRGEVVVANHAWLDGSLELILFL